jgi:hypothetical protein
MLHAMYAAARREDFLAEARRSRLVAQWRASSNGRQADRRRPVAMPALRMRWKTLPLAGALQGGIGGRQGI